MGPSAVERGYFTPPLPRVIAHRGLATEAPENTMLAFLKALSVGADYLETDVHVSADGISVISHDPDLSRVASRAVRVDQLTMPELRRVDLGEGQGFSSLAELLDAFPDARINIDVKAAGAIAPTIAAIQDARAVERVLIASFDEKRRAATVAGLPGVASSASSATMAKAIAAVRLGSARLVRRALAGVNAVQVPERYKGIPVVSERSIRLLHEAGAEVHVWTVNEPDDMERLLDLGVDGLVTDRADLAVEIVKKRRDSRK